MKILFCGTVVPEETEYRVKDISAAGNRFQNNMIKNLERAGHEVISCSFLGMDIPVEIKESLIGNYIFKDNGLLRGVYEYHKLLKRRMSDTDIVMCYNIAYAWLVLPLMAKWEHRRSIVIMADYSESISYGSIWGKVYAGLQLWSMRQFDTVIGLSENMKNKLWRKQKFVLMEGGIDEELYNAFSYKSRDMGKPVIFMYSGLLNHVTGVNMLLEAMKQVKRKDIRLLISGKGELGDTVKEVAESDDRICYLGHLPYEEYIQKLQEADVLINPRNMNLPENQNNFPSKIMDYLAAGKEILSTRFAGWERFAENIVFCESSVEGIKDSLEEAEKFLGNEDRRYMENRERAEQFKWSVQLKKIL